jgi:hypothetical protein
VNLSNFYTEKPKKKKFIDLSFNEYEFQMKNSFLAPEVSEFFVHRKLSKIAENTLNNSSITDELHREKSRRRIDFLRS